MSGFSYLEHVVKLALGPSPMSPYNDIRDDSNEYVKNEIEVIHLQPSIISSFRMKKPQNTNTGTAHIGPMNVDASSDGDAAPMSNPIDCATVFVRTTIVLNRKNRFTSTG